MLPAQRTSIAPRRFLASIAHGYSLHQLNLNDKCRRCGSSRGPYNLYICPQCLIAGFGSKSGTAGTLNPFDLFSALRDRPMSFDLDVSELEKEYKGRMWKLHPDMIQARGGSQTDLDAAGLESGYLQSSFRQLQDPISRAHAVAVWGFGQSGIEENDSIEDRVLLMDVLEATEIVEDSSTVEQITAIQSIWESRLEECLESLRSEFNRLQALPTTKIPDSEFNECQRLLQSLRLIAKLVNAAKDKVLRLQQQQQINRC
eukprot:Protomagalhaensia_sp_Gyna_25__3318@NODE_2_length_10425_cov_76_179954_g1_i0_p7_GENE_NODE_2_length_10425_cov_76_179954_g1_i0NODE_2_length_10425_cov_76_179954_g1_i0_p7_ORF_typecomplete_len258_score45_10HSCB_C/PF07743_13/2_1e03HSCB_C/PF07743_13/5_4e05_NODE_2_length_10425_cov_76_179954_g1_i017572530